MYTYIKLSVVNFFRRLFCLSVLYAMDRFAWFKFVDFAHGIYNLFVNRFIHL